MLSGVSLFITLSLSISLHPLPFICNIFTPCAMLHRQVGQIPGVAISKAAFRVFLLKKFAEKFGQSKKST